MTHEEKVAKLIQDLGAKGYSQHTVAPPLFRLLWKQGSKIPPPLFLSFWKLFAITGGFFGVAMTIAFFFFFHYPMWLAAPDRFPLIPAVISNLAMCTILFGVPMAAYFGYLSRKLKLPEWKDYPVA